MQLKSILNRVQKHPSFVYETVRLVEHPQLSIEVRVRPRAGTRATCSQCRRRAPGYDTQAVRRFDFVPLWHIPVVFLYAMRRVSCPRCGVRVEALPWATGKHRLTDAYAWFLAGWAKRLSWQEVAAAFPTSWDTVYRAVRMAVDWGLAHHDLTNIEAIGVDELSRRRGQRYLTLVYQIDGHCKRLLWVGRERKAATLEGFFDWFGAARSAALYFVCSDMWKPYLKVVAERAGQAVQVLDRFHIMSHFSQAIDEVRAAEARKLAAEGRAPVLKHSRWLLLKRPENLTDGQAERLAELVRRNLRTVRAYLLKEDFQSVWGYQPVAKVGVRAGSDSTAAIECRTLNGMAMGKRPAARQASPMWVNTEDLPTNDGHPFFERLNRVLSAHSGETDHPFRWQTDHLFRRKPITRSDANRSPVGAKRRGTKS